MADIAAAGEASIGKPDVGGPVCREATQVAGDTFSTRLEEAERIGPEWHGTRSTVKNGKVISAQAWMIWFRGAAC